MAPSRAAEAENKPWTPSPTESAFSTVSADGELALRNAGKKSLAQELEDVMERNQSRNEDAPTIAENPVNDTVFTWIFSRSVEGFTSQITYAEAAELLKRAYEEPRNRDAPVRPELATDTALVVTIICSLLVLAVVGGSVKGWR
ncbi:uncharacterized protein FSUBG_13298 [Fusarium subglutinans]|uniref:Uncharacterized protein n=1 Tax=Gibberella subglutinans TaxID=42677 RepID=A0A8H5KY04_GIBSU|nr:uncharacterized protein FSUBG_13298 [Fusarium subglutinans]KAF5580833.1 hypothetical protein FSUBG_13298 [Fusarium subglutinans]